MARRFFTWSHQNSIKLRLKSGSCECPCLADRHSLSSRHRLSATTSAQVPFPLDACTAQLSASRFVFSSLTHSRARARKYPNSRAKRTTITVLTGACLLTVERSRAPERLERTVQAPFG